MEIIPYILTIGFFGSLLFGHIFRKPFFYWTLRHTGNYSFTIRVDEPSDILPRVRDTLQKAGFKNIVLKRQELFYANTAASFSSWGEHVKVQIREDGHGKTIEFVSRCVLPTQIVDWGKNKRNAQCFQMHWENQSPLRP